MDRVQLIKRESAALGGDDADAQPWPEPIAPQEDAIEAAGFYLQDVSNRDENVLLSRSGDDMTFEDVNNASGWTLSQVAVLPGRSGGQTLIGGTAAGNDLTLQSTSNATRGSILFGNSAYDENANRLGIGELVPAAALHVVGDVIVTGTVKEAANTASLTILGGLTAGANLELYGSTHATQANDAFLDADVTTFRTADGTGTVLVVNASSNVVTFSADLLPDGDNTRDIGSTSVRVAQVIAQHGRFGDSGVASNFLSMRKDFDIATSFHYGAWIEGYHQTATTTAQDTALRVNTLVEPVSGDQVNTASAVRVHLDHNGAGGLTNWFALQFRADLSAAPTGGPSYSTNNIRFVDILAPTLSNGATVNNLYGIYIRNLTSGSTVNTSLHIEGGTNAIQADAGDVLLGGNVRIGDTATSPNEALEVVGGVLIDAASGTTAGTIQWTGTNFQGYNGSGWVNLDETGTLTGSGSDDQVAVWTATGIEGTADLTFSNTAGLVMSGNFAGQGLLIDSTSGARIYIDRGADTNSCDLYFRTAGTAQWQFAMAASGGSESLRVLDASGNQSILLQQGTGTTIFNNTGLAKDFQIESDNEANMFRLDGTNDRVGIGTAPATRFHVHDEATVVRLQDTTTGDAALTKDMAGLELVIAGLSATNKYTPALKFMSTDPQFTTESPKFLAAIVGRATEEYSADTSGGMAIDFAITDNAPGTTNVPVVAMTIDHSGNVGIGQTDPSESLHLSGAALLGSASGTTAGTVQWTGTNFQGYDGSGWVNLDEVGTITGSGTDNQVAVWTSSSAIEGTADFTFGTSDGLQISGAFGGNGLEIDSSTGARIAIDRGADTNECGLRFRTAGVAQWNLSMFTGGGNEDLRLLDSSSNSVVRFGQGTGETVFNDQSLAKDFRVESDGQQQMLYVDGTNNRVGIGTLVGTGPQTRLHVRGSDPVIRLDDTVAAFTALTKDMSGLELNVLGMSLTNKYSAALKFTSADPQFTTESPKFLAAIVGRATEEYSADTSGGMAIDFAITDNAPGTTNVPVVAMTIDHSGNVGIGETDPSESLHLSGAAILGNAAGTTTGTIRWDGSNFQGRNASGWVDLDNDPSTVTGSGSDDQVAVWTATGIEGTSALTFSSTAGMVMSGNLAGDGLLIDSSSGAGIYIDRGTDTSTCDLHFRTAGTAQWQFAMAASGGSESLRVLDASGNQSLLFQQGTGTTIFNNTGLEKDFQIESGNEANMFRLDGTNDRVGIGTAPDTRLHVHDETPILRIEDTTGADTALTKDMAGLELVVLGMSLTNKYTSALKFLSADPQFTTENPKFLAGIVGRATEEYSADTSGGMAIDFAITDNAPGTTNVPVVAMTIDHSGNVGIGQTDPSESLHLSGAAILGSASGTTAGAIQWTGSNFQGYTGSAWVNLDDQDDVTGSGADDQVAVWSGSSTLEGTANFTFSSTAGINIAGNLAGTGLVIDSSSGARVDIDRGGDAGAGELRLLTAGTAQWRFGLYQSGGNEGLRLLDASSNVAFAVAQGTGETVFNESGLAKNFRIESDNDINTFFVDGTNDRVGIGLATPGAKLNVQSDLTGAGDATVVYATMVTTNDQSTTAQTGEVTGIQNRWLKDGAGTTSEARVYSATFDAGSSPGGTVTAAYGYHASCTADDFNIGSYNAFFADVPTETGTGTITGNIFGFHSELLSGGGGNHYNFYAGGVNQDDGYSYYSNKGESLFFWSEAAGATARQTLTAIQVLSDAGTAVSHRAFQTQVNDSTSGTQTGVVMNTYVRAYYSGSGTTDAYDAIRIQLADSGTPTGTVTNYNAIRILGDVDDFTVTNYSGLRVIDAATAGTGSIGTQWGVYVDNINEGTNTYGVWIQGGGTAALHVDSGKAVFNDGVVLGDTADTTEGTVRFDATADHFYGRIDGSTWAQLDNASDAVTGTGVANQVAYFSSANVLAGDTDLTFNGTTLTATDLAVVAAAPKITLTDSTTNADALIDAESSAGSLFICADDNDEVASSVVGFRVDGTLRWSIDASGDLFPNTSDDNVGSTSNPVNALIGRLMYAGTADTSIILSGGSASGSGADMTLYGESHATLASQAYYDATKHTFRNAAGSDDTVVIEPGADTVTITANAIAGAAGTYNLGSSGTRWLDVYGVRGNFSWSSAATSGQEVAHGIVLTKTAANTSAAIGCNVTHSTTHTTGTQSQTLGFQSFFDKTTAGDVTTIRGFLSSGNTITGTGDVANFIHFSAGTVTVNDADADVTNFWGLRVGTEPSSAAITATAGTVGTAYGVSVGDLTAASTNSYGFHIADAERGLWVQASQNYGIYVDGSTGHAAYFDGAVGIGKDPDTPLHAYNSASAEVATFESDATGASIHLADTTSTSADHVRVAAIGDELVLYADNAEKLRMTSTGATITGNLLPEADNTRSIGNTTYRLYQLVARIGRFGDAGVASQLLSMRKNFDVATTFHYGAWLEGYHQTATTTAQDTAVRINSLVEPVSGDQVNVASGARIQMDHNGAGGLTTWQGVQFRADMSAAPSGGPSYSTSNIRYVDVLAPTLSGGATVNNVYGVYIRDQTAGTSLNYGLYVEGASGGSSNLDAAILVESDYTLLGGNTRVGDNDTATTPFVEMFEVSGAILIGGASGTTAGTIQWDGSNFQGYDGADWINLDQTGTVLGTGNENEIAVWTSTASTLQGDADFTWDQSTFVVKSAPGAATDTRIAEFLQDTRFLYVNPRGTAAGYGTLADADDTKLVFGDTSGSGNGGSLVLMPWATGTKGVTITVDGQVGVGVDPSVMFHVSAGDSDGILLRDNDTTGSAPFIRVLGKRTDANTSQDFGGKIALERHYTGGAISNNINLGSVFFGGNHTDGTEANVAYPASISGVAEGTFSDINTMPTGLVFRTGSVGRADLATPNIEYGTERLRITNDGNVEVATGDIVLGTGGKGILSDSDAKAINITGGSSHSVSNGARLRLFGNSHADTGDLRLFAGDVSGGDIVFYTGAAASRMTIDNAGDVTITNQLGVGGAAVNNNYAINAGDDINTSTLYRIDGTDVLNLATDLSLGAGTGHTGETLIYSGGGTLACTFDASQNALFAGNVEINDASTTTLTIHSTTSGATANIELGTGGSGNRNAFIDMVGDDTYTDPGGLRIIRNNTGANATSQLIHQGTGDFELRTDHGAELVFAVNGAQRWAISTAGNLYPITDSVDNIGTSSLRMFNVYSRNFVNGQTDSQTSIAGGSIGTSGANIVLYGPTHATFADEVVYNAGLHSFRTQDGTSTHMTINSSDAVTVNDQLAVGGTNPSSAKLYVVDDATNSVGSNTFAWYNFQRSGGGITSSETCITALMDYSLTGTVAKAINVNLFLETSSSATLTVARGMQANGSASGSSSIGTYSGLYSSGVSISQSATVTNEYLFHADGLLSDATTSIGFYVEETGLDYGLYIDGAGTAAIQVDAGACVFADGVVVGDSSATTQGTIAYNSGAFEGYTASGWVSLEAGSVSGSGVANRLAIWSGTNALTSDADLTWDGTDLVVIGNVGIGESSPATKLHVKTAESLVTPSVDANEVLIENSANCGITIASGTSSTGMIAFADSDDNDVGWIKYDHNAGEMLFRVDTRAMFELAALGSTHSAAFITNAGGTGYGSVLRMTEGATYRGGYIRASATDDDTFIGVHDTADSLTSSDIDAISIERSSGDVTIEEDLYLEKLAIDRGTVEFYYSAIGWVSQTSTVVTVSGTGSSTIPSGQSANKALPLPRGGTLNSIAIRMVRFTNTANVTLTLLRKDRYSDPTTIATSVGTVTTSVSTVGTTTVTIGSLSHTIDETEYYYLQISHPATGNLGVSAISVSITDPQFARIQGY